MEQHSSTANESRTLPIRIFHQNSYLPNFNPSVSFNHSFYSASSSPLLLRGTPVTARIQCRSFTPKCHRQQRVKDLPKVPTLRLEQDSNPQSFGQKASNLPLSHPAHKYYLSAKFLPRKSL